MRKGNLVKLNRTVCFTVRNGGEREFALTNGLNDDRLTVETLRPTTVEEREDWRNSAASKGMNSAGETKLPPLCAVELVHVDDVLILERARCRPLIGWSHRPGMAKVLNPRTGESAFIKRGLLEVV
jgi:hypothetical protein